MPTLHAPLEINITWGDDFSQFFNLHMITRPYGDAFTRDAPRYVEIVQGEEIPVAALYHEATAYMTVESAQRLIDRLWALGLRPKDDASHGQLEALQNHLKWAQSLAERLFNKVLGDE